MAEPFLEMDERIAVQRLVASLYEFTDMGPRGRRVFLQETAGLGRFVPGIDLSGDPLSVARDVVGRLERFGELPERPTYHALGALLSAILELADTGQDEATLAARLIVRYSLVGDTTFVASLRDRFQIVEQAVRQPQVIAPRQDKLEIPPGPEFAPMIEDEAGLESIIHSADNFLDVQLLVGALYCAQAVGRIEIPTGTAVGTGFLVGPDLLLTNQHVLKNKDYLEEAVVRFGHLMDSSGVAAAGKVVPLRSDFYFSSPAESLDYALSRLAEAPLADLHPGADLEHERLENLLMVGRHRGYLALSPHVPIDGARVNIIQHPDGDPLKVVLTQNYIVHRRDTRVQYVADTMDGSSGSPVFNHKWEVVALHHSGSPYPPEDLADRAKRAWKGRFRVNEGIPIRALLEDFRKNGIERHLPQS